MPVGQSPEHVILSVSSVLSSCNGADVAANTDLEVRGSKWVNSGWTKWWQDVL